MKRVHTIVQPFGSSAAFGWSSLGATPFCVAAARPVGGRVAGPSLAASFPPALLESALAVWKASVRQTGRISKLHEEVSQVLWSLGMVHTNEHITPDGLFCVDIAMQDSKVCSLLCCAMCC